MFHATNAEQNVGGLSSVYESRGLAAAASFGSFLALFLLAATGCVAVAAAAAAGSSHHLLGTTLPLFAPTRAPP